MNALAFICWQASWRQDPKHPLLLCSSMAGIFYCSLQQVGRGGNCRTHPLAAWLRRVYNTQSSASVCIGVRTMSSFPVLSQWTLDWDLSLKTGLHFFFPHLRRHISHTVLLTVGRKVKWPVVLAFSFLPNVLILPHTSLIFPWTSKPFFFWSSSFLFLLPRIVLTQFSEGWLIHNLLLSTQMSSSVFFWNSFSYPSLSYCGCPFQTPPLYNDAYLFLRSSQLFSL